MRTSYWQCLAEVVGGLFVVPRLDGEDDGRRPVLLQGWADRLVVLLLVVAFGVLRLLAL